MSDLPKFVSLIKTQNGVAALDDCGVAWVWVDSADLRDPRQGWHRLVDLFAGLDGQKGESDE